MLCHIYLFVLLAGIGIGSVEYIRWCERSLPASADIPPEIALTFDDGPHPVYTKKLLDGLRKRGVKATFFLIGENIEGNEELVKQMAEDGHLIGNHTWSHNARFPLRGERFVREEVERGAKAVGKAANLAGSKRIKLFRPPFGVTNPIIGRVVRSEGYCSIGWSIRSFDTVASTPDRKSTRLTPVTQ